jgi:hypothetical protein
VPSLLDITQVSPTRAYTTFQNPPSTAFTASQVTINAVLTIKDCLVQAGWIYLQPVYATATLTSPFGWGYLSFQSWVCTIAGDAFFFYDPTAGPPPSGTFNGATIIAVSVLGNPEANLAAAITGQGIFTATVYNSTTILLTANQPGILGDGIVVDTNASIAIGSISQGGGYILQSVPQVDIDGYGNTAFIGLTVVTGAPGSGNLILSWTIGAVNFDFYPGVTESTWALTASPFQAMFFTPDCILTELRPHNNFCWISTPIIPQSLPSLSYAAFLAQPNDLPNVSTLGYNTMPCDQWVAGDYTTGVPNGAYGQAGWSIVFDHSEGANITDPIGNAVLSPALLQMYSPSSVPPESRIIGYPPDCFVSTVPAPMWTQIYQDNLYWRCVATQDEPPGAMWMASGETTGQPGPPPPNHTYATGLCNVFGPEVTWVSGDMFTVAMVGLPIVIDGNFSSTVNSFIDSEHIGISPPDPVLAGLTDVPFSIQLS